MRRVIWHRPPPAGVMVAGLVLAGGRGTRMGGRDKGLVRDRGVPMAERAAARLAPLCDLVVVSANRNLSRYAAWADVVTNDGTDDFRGPLAGISAGLSVVRARFVVVCPCDVDDVTDEVPAHLLRALRRHRTADAAVIRDDLRLQPLLMAFRGRSRAGLDEYLASGRRAVRGWLDTVDVVEVPFRGVVANRNITGHAGGLRLRDLRADG